MDEKFSGCSSCGTSACNKINTFDWLADIPQKSEHNFVEVSFSEGIRKDFFYNGLKLNLKTGDLIVVPGMHGYDMGVVGITGFLAEYQIKKKKLDVSEIESKKILRLPNDVDKDRWKQKHERELKMLIQTRKIVKNLKLEMKISKVELQADFKKGIFYFISNDRIDFRELIKKLATEFIIKIEMKQVGVRQEASLVGGIGSCGRTLCCGSWLKDFKSINTTVARYQNLSINQVKLSGQCGRLKCCLNYELDVYVEAISIFPKNAQLIKTSLGLGKMMKKDIFKKNITYYFSDISTHKTFSIDEVINILDKNKNNISAVVSNMERSPEMRESNRGKIRNSEKLNFSNVESLKVPDLKYNRKKNNRRSPQNNNTKFANSPNNPNPQRKQNNSK